MEDKVQVHGHSILAELTSDLADVVKDTSEHRKGAVKGVTVKTCGHEGEA